MPDCIFCKIAKKELKSNIVYEDEHVVAFPDINPMAPVHLQVIPKEHIPTFMDLQSDDKTLDHLVATVQKLAREQKLDKGFRVVINCGAHGAQSVYHLHFHLLGGRQMTWPPG